MNSQWQTNPNYSSDLWFTFENSKSKREIEEFIAYCTSDPCVSRAGHTSSQNDRINKYGVKKEIRKTEVFCPECGHAIYWSTRKL